jgi:diguanylate cyclase (GGDEF)-like protein
VLARFGGDEFIALLPETETRGAKEMGERIRRAIEGATMEVRGGDIGTTVSVGVASYPSDGGNLEVIMDKADKAMYRAKQQGRNRVAAASDE